MSLFGIAAPPVQAALKWSGIPLAFLLASSAVNSKLAGATWLAFVILGLICLFTESAEKDDTRLLPAAKIWLIACTAALALRAIPQFYWSDSWGERHAEFRLLFGAIGLLGMCRLAIAYPGSLTWIQGGAVVALWSGFGLMLMRGSLGAPTNQIPWGAAMSLMVCLLFAQLFKPSLLLRWRVFYASGVLAGLGAVMLSQARGSYGIVLWVAGVLLWQLVRGFMTWRVLLTAIVGLTLAAGVLVQLFPQLESVPRQRLAVAITEFQVSAESGLSQANGSVGARLYLWKRAMEVIPDHLFFGVGRLARIELIHQWGVEAGADMTALGHLHNDFLNGIFDQGLMALASLLLFPGALLLMAMKIRKCSATAATGLAGVFFMHLTSSLTNVNFAHNYYPTMLSVTVTLCLMLSMNDDSKINTVKG